MKICLFSALMLIGFGSKSFAAPVDDRDVNKGTILNYTIKDGTVSYKLKATVMEWNTAGNIKVQWQTSGTRILKGTYTMLYSAIQYSLDLKVKPKPGLETLGKDICRWFVSYNAFDDMFNDEIETDLTADEDFVTLLPDEDEKDKEILYNNVKTTMDYTEGSNVTNNTRITIGFIAYNSEVIILQKYVKGSFSMTLASIQSPVVNVVTQVDQLAKDFANDILKAMTPKGKVEVKKMEPAKFAVVKSKYPVLALIENYDPTQAGSVKKPITETYEYRVGSNSPNPPSLIDCLTADLKVMYNQKTNFGLFSLPETVTNKTLPSEVAKKLLGVYQSYDYLKIPGYRPWSNWRFINGLTEEKRNQLALELQRYIADYGFTE